MSETNQESETLISMSVGQIAKAAGVHHTTVYRKAINLYPDRFFHGVRCEFNMEESMKILEKIGKKNFLIPPNQVAFRKDISENKMKSNSVREQKESAKLLQNATLETKPSKVGADKILESIFSVYPEATVYIINPK